MADDVKDLPMVKRYLVPALSAMLPKSLTAITLADVPTVRHYA